MKGLCIFWYKPLRGSEVCNRPPPPDPVGSLHFLDHVLCAYSGVSRNRCLIPGHEDGFMCFLLSVLEY